MMIAVASDVHGAKRRMDSLLGALPLIDALCFLGDMDADAEYLDWGLREARPRAEFYAVAGNNDPFSKRPRSQTLFLGGVETLITHGHLYRGIRGSRAQLAMGAKRLHCALALYGHTHVACDEEIEGVRLVNPGALTMGSWALLSLDAGQVSISFQGA